MRADSPFWDSPLPSPLLETRGTWLWTVCTPPFPKGTKLPVLQDHSASTPGTEPSPNKDSILRTQCLSKSVLSFYLSISIKLIYIINMPV